MSVFIICYISCYKVIGICRYRTFVLQTILKILKFRIVNGPDYVFMLCTDNGEQSTNLF